MEHNKDQSGAVASEKPQFPWNPDPINHEWTQPEIAAIHAFGEGCFQAGVSSVQSRAAVRGEAVAWAVTSERGGIHKLSVTESAANRKAATWRLEWPNNNCRVRPLVFGDENVSARSADAPSEPSDNTMPNGLPPISASTYGSKTVCGLEQLCRTQRVAPDNLPRWIDNMKGADPTIDSLIEYIVWQSRAADALDSQPTPHQNTLDAITGAIAYGRQGTNPPPTTDHWLAEYWQIGQQLAELGKTSAWDNVTPIAEPFHAQELDAARLDFIEAHPELRLQFHKKHWALRGFTNYEATVFPDVRAAIDAARAECMASSQPTDGGVRNG